MLRSFVGLGCMLLALTALPANSDIQVLSQQEMATFAGGCDTCVKTSWLGDYSRGCKDDGTSCTKLSHPLDFRCHLESADDDEEVFPCFGDIFCYRGGEIQVRICYPSKNCTGNALSGDQACQNRFNGCPRSEEMICECVWGFCVADLQKSGCQSVCRITSS